MPDSELSNQALYGYQAASSPYTYQSQNQGAYADQRSDSREGYYNNDAYGQYGTSQGQNTVEQDNYYPNQQQYQNTADQGSYYPG